MSVSVNPVRSPFVYYSYVFSQLTISYFHKDKILIIFEYPSLFIYSNVQTFLVLQSIF